MLSEYDRKNVTAILDGEGDWFHAILLRYIAGLNHSERAFWSLRYAQEVILVRNRIANPQQRESLYTLMVKADSMNSGKIAFVLRSMADRLDKRKTA